MIISLQYERISSPLKISALLSYSQDKVKSLLNYIQFTPVLFRIWNIKYTKELFLFGTAMNIPFSI